MPEIIIPGISAAAIAAFFQVVLIDLTLAGDNAVAVGLAAAGLPAKQRRQAIILGMAAAVVMLIGFALVATQLLKVVGLLFAGGILLLYVCWKMWKDLRDAHHHDRAVGELALEDATGVAVTNGDSHGEAGAAADAPAKSLRKALIQILLADISMSLDNVLAVAGAARDHPVVLVFGLGLSITATAIAATWIAKLLHKLPWLGYVGLVLVFYVAITMMWHGHQDVVRQMGWTASYNAAVPSFMDIPAAAPGSHG